MAWITCKTYWLLEPCEAGRTESLEREWQTFLLKMATRDAGGFLLKGYIPPGSVEWLEGNNGLKLPGWRETLACEREKAIASTRGKCKSLARSSSEGLNLMLISTGYSMGVAPWVEEILHHLPLASKGLLIWRSASDQVLNAIEVQYLYLIL